MTTPETKRDIESIEDIKTVVDAFYGKIEQDPLLGRYFAVLDMRAHLPKMYAFWDSVLFHTGSYHGRPFDAHVRLDGLAAEHFRGWLERFHRTIDSHFAGEAAQRMKDKAGQIATIFQIRLGLLEVLE